MHHLIAENEAVLRSARAFVLEAVRDGEDCIRREGGLDLETKVLMRLASTTAIQRAKQAALDECSKTGKSCRVIGSVCADGSGPLAFFLGEVERS